MVIILMKTVPCAAISGPDPPAFVGDNYYCESGDTGTYSLNSYYTSDIRTVGWIWLSPC